jgi:hypothetical protein
MADIKKDLNSDSGLVKAGYVDQKTTHARSGKGPVRSSNKQKAFSYTGVSNEQA